MVSSGIIISICLISYIISSKIIIKEIAGIIILIASILNLIFTKKLLDYKKSKKSIILFSIFAIIECLVVFAPIIMFSININNLKNAIPKLQEEKNLETYVYKKDNNYIFLDNKGNEIAKRDFDELTQLSMTYGFIYNLKVNGNNANLGVAKKGNKVIIINSQGEEMFSLCNMFDDYFKVSSNFINYVCNNNIYGIEKNNNFEDKEKEFSRKNFIQNEKALKKYEETNTLFEENENYEYIYFKNEEIMDKILQVVIKNREIEDDTKLSNHYLQVEFNEELKRNEEMIEEFYKYKKEYYLIDFSSGIRTKLECNNLIYEAYYNENNKGCENILLYSDGDIPFYDTNETGYFDKEGNKITINTSYLIIDVDKKYRVIMAKESETAYFMSKETNQIEKEIKDGLITILDSFYIKFPTEDNIQFTIYDRNLNEIAKTFPETEPIFLGNNFILIPDKDISNSSLYYYDNENITLKEREVPREKAFSINAPSNDSKENGNTLYYLVGIIKYY